MDNLQKFIEEGVRNKSIEYLGEVRTYHPLSKELFRKGKRLSDYESIILLPVVYKDGGRADNMQMLVYGVLSYVETCGRP